MTRPARSRPRLSGPGELLAALPLLLGFPPRESLVLVCLEGERGRVGLTLRYDLPEPSLESAAVQDLAERLEAAGLRRAYAVLVTDEQAVGLPRQGLMTSLRDALPVDLVDVLLLRSDRWWSYLCDVPACCPPSGSAVPVATPTLTLVRAEAALDGRAVLPSREALVRSLAPPALPGPHLTVLRQVQARLADEVLQQSRRRVRRRLLLLWERALDAASLPPAGPAAELVLGLHDVLVRDEVLTWSVGRSERLLTVLLHLARSTPAPFDGPVCTCLAWTAYARGDGAIAQTALDRALATDPGYSLALLLREAVDRQVPPRALRAVGVRTAAALRRSR
ncbi:MAG: uncharacterized protein JWN17_1885 [Frankiales bacterium]|nr:uncharacterized protein [Frankiales bacterium]